jgi:hypothetical protein
MQPKYTLIEKVKQNIGLGLGLTVIGTSIGIVGITGIKAQQKFKNTTYISVKGAAGIPVRSDVVSWDLYIRANNKPLAEGNNQIAKHTKLVYDFLIQAGLTPEEINTESVNITTNYKKIAVQRGNWSGFDTTDEVKSYSFARRITVHSKKLELTQTAYENSSQLVSQGIDMNIAKPAYRISNIEDKKLEVLQKAIRNAHQRAQLFTEFDDSKTLELKNAQSSIFQITRPEGENHDYGCYDTTTVDKVARTVVTVTFKLS